MSALSWSPCYIFVYSFTLLSIKLSLSLSLSFFLALCHVFQLEHTTLFQVMLLLPLLLLLLRSTAQLEFACRSPQICLFCVVNLIMSVCFALLCVCVCVFAVIVCVCLLFCLLAFPMHILLRTAALHLDAKFYSLIFRCPAYSVCSQCRCCCTLCQNPSTGLVIIRLAVAVLLPPIKLAPHSQEKTRCGTTAMIGLIGISGQSCCTA